MIRGLLLGTPPYRRPYITARVALPAQSITGEVPFLVDTGADTTLLAPTDALRLGIDVAALPRGVSTTGVGGTTPTAIAAMTITLGTAPYTLTARILRPATPAQRRTLSRIPSLLGRDILAHFALFLEDATDDTSPHDALRIWAVRLTDDRL